MCLILFAREVHPKYKLIIAANRDEFYNRGTIPANFWKDKPTILAGRDLQAGGTWMGVNKIGEISMLTNYRDLSKIMDDAPSRGHLVTDFLLNDQSADQYLTDVESKGNLYNGFNIICGTSDELLYYGNYQNGVHKVKKGIHGLSNALLNTSWPKVVKGKVNLEKAIAKNEVEKEELFELLYDDMKPSKEQLPDTGVGLEMEEMLSPLFIKSESYGSRCSTVIMIDKNDSISFAERTYNTNDFSHTTQSFNWKI